MEDLRGRTSLIELAGACKRAKGVISVDAGPMHIAAAVGTKVFAVVGNDIDGYGASPIRLWEPKGGNITRSISSNNCKMCGENRFKNSDCIAESHKCMEGVKADQVIEWLENIN